MIIRLLEDNTVDCSDDWVVNSTNSNNTSCLVGKSIADAFPYEPEDIFNRPMSQSGVITEVKFRNGGVVYIVCDIECHMGVRDVRVPNYLNEEIITVDCLEDLSTHPAKVQAFCNIVFTDEVKAEFIASLPRQEVENEAEQQRTVEIPVMIQVEQAVPAVTEQQAIVNEETGEPEIVEVEITPATTKMVEVQKTEIVDEPYEAYEEMQGNVLVQVPARS